MKKQTQSAQTTGTFPKTDRKSVLNPHEALARYAAIQEAITIFEPQRLAPDDLLELQYLENQLDRAQNMASLLSDTLSTLWDAATNEDSGGTSMPGALWLAHEYAEMMADVANAYGHVQQRISQHYQAAAGG